MEQNVNFSHGIATDDWNPEMGFPILFCAIMANMDKK
jgi:hypothetical protein